MFAENDVARLDRILELAREAVAGEALQELIEEVKLLRSLLEGDLSDIRWALARLNEAQLPPDRGRWIDKLKAMAEPVTDPRDVGRISYGSGSKIV